MGFDLQIFQDKELQADFLEWLVEERSINIQKYFGKFWEYYTNRMIDNYVLSGPERKAGESGRYYLQAQEYGLPTRITGLLHSANSGIFGGQTVKDIQRKEVVIENDIAWRINAAVDFLFGKPINFVNKSPNKQKRAEIESILKALFSVNGGLGFFQDLAVLGSVYGFVDCLVRPGKEIIEQLTSGSSHALCFEEVLHMAQKIDLELIEAPRALPILDENNYKKVSYYVQHFNQKKNSVIGKSFFLSKLLSSKKQNWDSRQTTAITEIISAKAWQRYENGQLVGEGELLWGILPLVHIQNMAQPFYYEGVSDVEQLMPLQDELNTRLSDRANRITFQSFKMYLGKGIEGFEDRPISPGRMWYTDNPDAVIEEFGGDNHTPSEDKHIAEIREAMDKISGVTPLVAGVIRDRVGNLTSAVALRLTLMGMLSKTERRRFTYGEGLKQIAQIVLSILDASDIYKTTSSDRQFEIIFPSPLPENMMEKLKEAQIKKELGVSTEHVLEELGYETKKQEKEAK